MCILIVEDEPITLLATATWLEDAGFTVMAAHDGSQAMDLLEQHPDRFTALITDFHMPILTGADVIVSMRQKYPAIPMIMTTALTHAVTNDWRLQYNVETLSKPYDPETLVKMLRNALNG